MALSLRTTHSSTIVVSWFNDLYNLLTGVMKDQPVSISNTLTLKGTAVDPSVAPSGALAAGTNLGIGVYEYAYTYVTQAGGESLPSPLLSKTTTTGNQTVNLTAIAVGPTGTYYRNIYRTLVGATQLQLLVTIQNNTTTTYTDTIIDADLGANAPTHSSFGGSLFVQNSGQATTAKLYQDGAVYLDNGLITSDGAGNLVAVGTGITPITITSPKNLKHLAMGTASVVTTGTVVTHNLGAVPTAAFACAQGGVLGGGYNWPETRIDPASLTSTTMKVYVYFNTDIWWLVVA